MSWEGGFCSPSRVAFEPLRILRVSKALVLREAVSLVKNHTKEWVLAVHVPSKAHTSATCNHSGYGIRVVSFGLCVKKPRPGTHHAMWPVPCAHAPGDDLLCLSRVSSGSIWVEGSEDAPRHEGESRGAGLGGVRGEGARQSVTWKTDLRRRRAARACGGACGAGAGSALAPSSSAIQLNNI